MLMLVNILTFTEHQHYTKISKHFCLYESEMSWKVDKVGKTQRSQFLATINISMTAKIKLDIYDTFSE